MGRRRDLLGWLGLASGLIALGLALLPGWIAPIYTPPAKPIEQSAIAAQFISTALLILAFAVLTGAILARYS